MSDLRQAAAAALEALEILDTVMQRSQRTESAITALKQALAEPEQPVGINGLTEAETDASASVKGLVGKPEQKKKPVAWIDERGFIASHADSFPRGTTVSPLYAHPPTPRNWVGLTDEEIDVGLCRSPYALQTAQAWRDGVEWAQEQLKEKNT